MKQTDKSILFNELYSRFEAMVYRTCCYYVADEADRSDLFQEIFVKIYTGLDGLRNRKAAKTWVYRIANNTGIQYVVKKKRHKQAGDMTVVERLPDSGPEDTEKRIREDEMINRLQLEIQDLPLLDRSLIVLFLENLSMREIAGVSGLSENNVRVRLHRIKKKLKEKTAKDYGN